MQDNKIEEIYIRPFYVSIMVNFSTNVNSFGLEDIEMLKMEESKNHYTSLAIILTIKNIGDRSCLLKNAPVFVFCSDSDDDDLIFPVKIMSDNDLVLWPFREINYYLKGFLANIVVRSFLNPKQKYIKLELYNQTYEIPISNFPKTLERINKYLTPEVLDILNKTSNSTHKIKTLPKINRKLIKRQSITKRGYR